MPGKAAARICRSEPAPARRSKSVPAQRKANTSDRLQGAAFVVVTGMSGSGKGSVLKAFEDLGYYCVDNLPVDLIPKFAELYRTSREIARAALVVDIREGEALRRFPAIYRRLRRETPALLIFLQASEESLVRRFSETRRPHPLGGELPLRRGIAAERKMLRPIHNLADLVVDTSQFNVHELRRLIAERFSGAPAQGSLLISCVSFGYRYGLPPDSDLVFDVRFLPNPNYVPRLQRLSGKHRAVADYIRSFPQTQQFLRRVVDLLGFLVPHYVGEGKSYLTISFGCTGGRHRSVMIAEAVSRYLASKGCQVKIRHRDLKKSP